MSATVEQLQEARLRAQDARERILPHRTTDQIIHALATTASRWIPADSPWRAKAVELAPGPTGFSPQMVHEAVTLTFSAITHEALGELVDRQLANRRVLDEFCLHGRVKTRATGPRTITQFMAGNIPCPAIVSICCGLLVRAANLIKLSSNDPIFPALFVESLRDVDPELADLVAPLEWSRTDSAVTEAALADTNAVIAYGDDHTINALRRLAPTGIPFLGYGHKVSLGVITKDALTAANLPPLCEAAAFDASVFDQQGCLSPHVFFVEERGEIGPKKFAATLADAMAAYHARIPRGPLTDVEAAQITTVRTGYEFRSESDKRVAVWASENPNEWTHLRRRS